MLGNFISSQIEKNNAIICIFSTGVGRTGVFIALCNMIERVRVEGVVDVFQTVRGLRAQRPAMVQTKVWSQLCFFVFWYNYTLFYKHNVYKHISVEFF